MEMQNPNGGFYSSLDAESEHIEGKYYLWSKAEIKSILSEAEYAIANEIYNLSTYAEIDSQENVLFIATSFNEYLNNHKI